MAPPRSNRRGLCVSVGRWRALPRPSRGGSALHARHDRRARRRDKGADRGRRRLSREHRQLGDRAAGSEAPRAYGAPVVAVGDSALGFWAAVGVVWPETREQHRWVHRLANVLDKLPRRLQPKAKQGLHAIMHAPTRAEAENGIQTFAAEYDAKYPKAVASLRRGQGQLLTFFDFPAEQWRHLRTSNIMESPFATVRLRQRVTKGAGSSTKALMMAFRLLAMAEERWRKVNGSELLPMMRAGVRFVDGVQEKPKSVAGETKENAA